MRISPGMLRTFVSILTCLVLPTQIHAQDDTNAAKITDPVVWGQMHQVMGGVSNKVTAQGGAGGPAGIYVNTMLHPAIIHAQTVSKNPNQVDDALKNYFGLLLDNKAVSGIYLLAQWSDLNPSRPCLPREPCLRRGGVDPYALNYLDDAFDAIDAWNSAHPRSPPKTLQLAVTPGFNSPTWLLDELTSCDGLFMNPSVTVSSSCGVTTIFYRTENKPVVQLPLPLPWNPTYKNAWNQFLVALNDHIQSRPTYIPDLVSIAVAGPTASSEEMILPNGNPSAADTNENANPLTLPGVSSSGSATVTVYQAWNCLLGNNYGVTGNCLSEGYGATSSYVNSDRAFVEEWAAAIDMFGQIFSGVTLTISTGNGLPNFPVASNPSFLSPPPAFLPDCGTSSTATMDCAAETAVLAYFSEPPVGGANAKATQSDGLTARDINPKPPGGARMKWLSETTSGGLTAMPGVVGGTQPVVSRMLGGLQFAKTFSQDPAFEGCLTGTTCTPTPSPEQALFNVLAGYFVGTSAASVFGASTTMNGSAPVVNAPINYLQIWDTDILYADGYADPANPKAGCTLPSEMTQLWEQLLSNPAPKELKKLKCYVPPPHVGLTNGQTMTAQDLLNLASEQILGSTAEAAFLPPPRCCPPYVWRNAFQGDYVCVTTGEQTQAAADTSAAKSNYSSDYTDYAFVPNVPYGVCKTSLTAVGMALQYRQAYMGDYVCVSPTQQTQVATDNSSLPSRICPPPPPRGPCPHGPTSCF